jgi:2-methylisocitrate lyase-like PEP mutase family enzyme
VNFKQPSQAFRKLYTNRTSNFTYNTIADLKKRLVEEAGFEPA